ncbi:MAG: dihydroorotase [Bacteroidales bacterium]|nr:dihydroorotase [Bacteroidales bacterium]
MTTLIKNALLINENKSEYASVFIENQRIKKIFLENENLPKADINIDATGLILIPGIIDDQVHFREPGLTHKADIASESAAAAAGGLTSFIEMPNTNPASITNQLLNEKFEIAKNTSFINYSFMLGATNDNIQEIKNIDKSRVAGIKMFLGSSTGNLLVDDDEVVKNILNSSGSVVAAHCEDDGIINYNLKNFKAKYGENIPSEFHPQIRSAEACYKSSAKAVEIAKKTGGRLHIFHLSTAKEIELLSNKPISEKKITAEVCVHHLWFNDADYKRLGNKIKWNPAVKTENDRLALIQALKDGKIDVVATDHAPHLLEEKMQVYTKSPSGGPMVQHSLLVMLELAEQNYFSIQNVIQWMCHNPAELFGIIDRGFVREGYFADLVLINPNISTKVKKENLLYKCKWSPLEGEVFKYSVQTTFVNGKIVYDNGKLTGEKSAKQLEFKV